MLRKLHLILSVLVAGSTAFGLIQSARAQTFQHQVADLLLTFRKVNPSDLGSYEVVVDIGQASNYVNAAIGTSLPVPQFSSSVLSPGCFNNLNNLSWAVTGSYIGTIYPGYTNYTLWVTVPRMNSAVRSADATRLIYAQQSTVKTKIDAIFGGASYVSKDLAISNQFNTPSFVRESDATYSLHIVSVWMASVGDSTLGTLNDTWPNSEPNSGNLENTTPGSFSGSVRSDLYEVRPASNAQGLPISDPHTGTSGLAYYVGYFQLNSAGTMTFTREAGAAVPPPPPQIVKITRAASTSTIYFTTTNGATYTLFHTNAAGLSTPSSNWPFSSTTLVGNGNTNSLTDTTTDPIRFYRVGVH